MTDFWNDIRYAFRLLGRNPAFAFLVVAILAVSVGVTSAVTGLVRTIILEPLPYRDPENLVAVWPEQFISVQEVFFLREQAQSLESIAYVSTGWGVAVRGLERPVQLEAARVSGNLFSTLGVPALHGSSFGEDAAIPGQDNVAVLSHRTWMEHFGGDPHWVGRVVDLDGAKHRIAGVMPAGFEIFQAADLWLPLAEDTSAWYHKSSLALGLARLREGRSVAAADEELKALIPRLRERLGLADDYGRSAGIAALHAVLVGPSRPMLLLFLASVFCLLLISTINVSGLLLARHARRQSEVAVRCALGASRRRLLRQFMAESGLLVLLSGVLGGVLSYWLVGLLSAWLPNTTPRLIEVAPDWRVVAISCLVSFLTWLAVSIGPVTVSTRHDLRNFLSRDAADQPGRVRFRSALVGGEIALASALTVAALLMVRTGWNLTSVEPGFDPDRVLSFRLQASGGVYEKAAARRNYFHEVMDSLAAVEGVETVGAIQHLPLSNFNWTSDFEIEGVAPDATRTPPRADWRIVAGRYFEAMGIPLGTGRFFSTADGPGQARALIVNQAFADRFLAGQYPIGKRVRAGNATSGEWGTIVGVVGNVRHRELSSPGAPAIYTAHDQYSHASMAIVMRMVHPSRNAVRHLSDRVWAIDPNIPISQIQTLRELVRKSIGTVLMVQRLLGFFAAAGLCLGGLGVYGVVATIVSQRTRELGIRQALGAGRLHLVLLVVGHGFRLAVAGIAVGLALAAAAGRLLTSFLFGVTPYDPASFAGVLGILVDVSLLACLLPTRAALQIAPSEALRHR